VLAAMWSSSNRRQHRIALSAIRIGTDDVMPPAPVRNLGIHIDADVSMRTRVVKTVSRVASPFYVVLSQTGHAVTGRRRARTDSLGLWTCDNRWTRGSIAR